MLTRKSGMLALVLGVAVIGGVACESDDVVIPPPPPEPVVVNVTPDNVPPVAVGATVTLVAVVTGSTNQAVTWTSSAPTVASVSAAGVVTALAPGQTTITATSAADPNARDAVSITVTGGEPPPPPPLVTIQGVFQNNLPVNPGNVQGVVDVVGNVDIAAGVTVSRIEVRVDGVTVCTQTIGGGGNADANIAAVPVPVTCSVNTAQLVNGAPRFPNGPHAFSVVVIGPDGSVLASATTDPFVFNNVNFLAVTATASGATATDNAGLVWSTGDLTVTVTPGIFTTGTVSSVTVTVFDSINGQIAQQTLTTPTAGAFTTTFTKAANTNPNLDVAGAEGRIFVTVTSVLSGNPGPQVVNQNVVPALRLDNDAPDTEAPDPAAAFAIPQTAACLALPPGGDPANCNWFGAATTLTGASRITNFGTLDDEGVNVNTVTFQFNTNLSATNTSTGWTTFTSPADLPQTTTTAGFLVRAVVCDALANCTNVLATASTGADVTAPTFDADLRADSIFETTADRDAADEFLLDLVENLSGFPNNFVQIQIVRTNAAGTVCVDLAGATSAVPAAGCAFNGTNATTFNLPAAGNGYFTVTVRAIDVAGNVSTTQTFVFLVDDVAPTAVVNSLNFSSTSVTVMGTITDDVEIRSHDVRLEFAPGGAGFQLPFVAMTADGSFGLPLTSSVAATGTAPIIRNVFDGANHALQAVGFGALDIANNFGSGLIGFSSPTASDGFDNPPSATSLTASGTTLCRTGTNPPCTGTAGAPATTVTSRTLTFTAETGPNTNNPISTVYFYAQLTDAQGTTYFLLVGQDNTAELSIDPSNNRTWTFAVTLDASQLPPRVSEGVGVGYVTSTHAIFVDAEGDAVFVNNGSISVF